MSIEFDDSQSVRHAFSMVDCQFGVLRFARIIDHLILRKVLFPPQTAVCVEVNCNISKWANMQL